jgi:hypothetical protein
MNLQRWIAVVATLSLLVCTSARADEPTPFAPGTWNLSLSSSYVDHIRYSEDRFYNFNVTAGYYFWKNSSFNVDFQGSYVDQPGGEALLGAAGLFGRTHLIVHNPWSLFIDGGGMVTYADHEVPLEGTNFNFIGKVGGGGSWEISDHTFLMGGVRYFHLSNAQIRGRDDNPSFDGVQYWAGVMWTW